MSAGVGQTNWSSPYTIAVDFASFMLKNCLVSQMETQSSSNNNINQNKEKEWRAEEAIAGNKAALEALRELITFPLLYPFEAKKLGLKVTELCNLLSFPLPFPYAYILLLLSS